MRRDPLSLATVGVLGGLGALHAAWAAGSSFPMKGRSELAAVIAGTDVVPPARECLAVAGALGAAAILVADAVPLLRSVRQVGVATVTGVLAVRGGCGIAGETERLVPWTPSARFVQLDRKYYGPLCLALSLGAARSLRR